MKLLQSCITCCCLLLFSAAYTQPKSGWVTGPEGKLKYVYKPATAKPYTPQKSEGRPVKEEAKKEKAPIDESYYPSKGEYKTADVTYEGEYRYKTNKNGYLINERHGYGKCVYKNGNNYEGNWLEDKMHGKGTYKVYLFGRTYTGEWKAGKFVGPGTFNSDILGEKDDIVVKEVTPVVIVKPSAAYDYTAPFADGFAAVRKGDKYGFIDENGKLAIPLIYDGSGSRFSEGLVSVKLKEKWGFINTKGVTIIPFKYNYASDFSEGLTWVLRGDKYGAINKKEVEIVPIKYDELKIGDGQAKVVLNGVTSYFYHTGAPVPPGNPVIQ